MDLKIRLKKLKLIKIFVTFQDDMSAKNPKNRKGPQKHQNTTAWKFDLHKSDPKTKLLQNLRVTNCCSHCTGVIEWKIKYGKYKPLSQPGKCVLCGEKRVKSAYHTICQVCAEKTGKCAKCGKVEEIVNKPEFSKAEAVKIKEELKQELKCLPERKRRTFLRYLKAQEKREFIFCSNIVFYI